MVYRLTNQAYKEMVAGCRREYPLEACGLLAGRESALGEKHYPITNTDASSSTYNMEPSQVLTAYKEIEAWGGEITAFYHSHTQSEAYPSPTDREKSLGGDILYVIVSLKESKPSVRAFHISPENVQEVRIALENTDREAVSGEVNDNERIK